LGFLGISIVPSRVFHVFRMATLVTTAFSGATYRGVLLPKGNDAFPPYFRLPLVQDIFPNF